MLVDVHAHLDRFKDVDKVIERAKKADVKVIISCGNTPEANEKTLELIKKYDIVKASLGLYPTDTLKLKEREIEKALEFIKKNRDKIVAIGEIGLDYFETQEEKKQKENFLRMIEFAEKLKKPVVVHSRKAEEECVEMLKSSRLKKILMHCFSGRKRLVKDIEDNGWYLSIPCIITYSSHFQMVAEKVNLGQLLTETDAPFLAPVKGERNEPKYIKEAVKKIAEIKKMTREEVEKNIFMNYQKLFL